MTLPGLLRIVVALLILVFVVKVFLALLPVLLFIAVVAVVGGGLYLRGASSSDRQRLARSARRLLRG